MKKKLFIIVMMMFMVLSITACGKKDKKEEKPNLEKLQDTINTNLLKYDNYTNFYSSYISEDGKNIIVILNDNSKESQSWFKKNISDSKYILFHQYETNEYIKPHLTILEDDETSSIYNLYYQAGDRNIYLASNLSDVYYYDSEGNQFSVKDYIPSVYQTFDDSINFFADILSSSEILRDGGTTIYKSANDNITLVVCHTVTGNRDIYISSYNAVYDGNIMCVSN